ncbi:uncharacterized protein LOC127751326 [Frankliniella occidentalis]|uniref:Uncharacterized protein LOC127751326 n=1 Tax=Frankliniella occidentalis TaxID=133901 RepID=A0A9C6X7M6_FRAOC|nr:uncharacterized protein LOC127751326 [Frankliniella occidentalis]
MSNTGLHKRYDRTHNRPPTNSIYVTNLPNDYEKHDVELIFMAYGIHFNLDQVVEQKTQKFKSFTINLQSIGEAVDALVTMHNVETDDWQKMYVCFDKPQLP